MHINLPDKLYYKIGEVAEAFSVNASLIRYWEKEFTQLNPKKSKSGSRLYTKKDLATLQHIYYLVKEKSYTLDGAKQKLKEERRLGEETIPANQLVISRLQKIKEELLSIKNQLS